MFKFFLNKFKELNQDFILSEFIAIFGVILMFIVIFILIFALL